jgi:hypothetical protein
LSPIMPSSGTDPSQNSLDNTFKPEEEYITTAPASGSLPTIRRDFLT